MEQSNHFDPLEQGLIAQFAKPSGLGSINLRALTPLQRALLIIDGTLTTFLEVYTLEPMDVQRLEHTVFRLPDDHVWLDAKKGSEIAFRRVMIMGSHRQTLYAYALASVVLDRVPSGVRDRLEIQGESLGRVLNENNLETRREILWYGKERVNDLPDPVRRQCDGSFYSRTYRIVFEGKPIALINEKFPASNELYQTVE